MIISTYTQYYINNFNYQSKIIIYLLSISPSTTTTTMDPFQTQNTNPNTHLHQKPKNITQLERAAKKHWKKIFAEIKRQQNPGLKDK